MKKSNEQEPLIPFVNVDGLLDVSQETDELDLQILTNAIERNKDEKRYSLDDVQKELEF